MPTQPVINNSPCEIRGPSGNERMFVPVNNEINRRSPSTKKESLRRYGQQQMGENSSGENNSGENSSGENNSGENNSGEHNSGENSSGENNSGENSSGENSNCGVMPPDIDPPTLYLRHPRTGVLEQLLHFHRKSRKRSSRKAKRT